MKRTNGQGGITLIALVVTIVVLLILAAITITFVLSDNGVFNTAREAGKENEMASVKEAVAVALLDVQTRYYAYDETNLTERFKDNFPSNMTPTVTSVTAAPGADEGDPATFTVTGLEVAVGDNTYTVTVNVAAGTITVAPKTEPTT